jgi:hypothetical protein
MAIRSTSSSHDMLPNQNINRAKTWDPKLDFEKLLSQSSFTENPEQYLKFSKKGLDYGDRIVCKVWEWTEGRNGSDSVHNSPEPADNLREERPYDISHPSELHEVTSKTLRVM